MSYPRLYWRSKIGILIRLLYMKLDKYTAIRKKQMSKDIKPSVTSKDIAVRLGLSQPTVSRILNGDPKYKVSTKTRQLIFSTADELGYRSNALAKALRNKRTDVIGLYTLPKALDTRLEFIGDLFGGLERASEVHRLDILVLKTFEGRAAEEIYGEMLDGRIDGAIVYINSDSDLLLKLQTSRLPIVALADTLPAIPSIGCCDEAGTIMLLEYLWSKGHRRFAFMTPRHHPVSVARREEAFVSFLTDKGLTKEDRLVVWIDNEDTGPGLDYILDLACPPSAVLCWNDRAAYHLLNHCFTRGIQVPKDLAIVGFDGFIDKKIPKMDLVTIKVPWYDMAVSAVDLLTELIAGNEVALETLLPIEFVPGNTA